MNGLQHSLSKGEGTRLHFPFQNPKSLLGFESLLIRIPQSAFRIYALELP